jgi:hypothetical protein
MDLRKCMDLLNQSIMNTVGIKDHSLNEHLFSEDYESTEDPELKRFKKLLYDHTIYVRYDNFVSSALKLADNISYDRFNVYYDVEDPQHSEHWMLAMVWPSIKHKVVNIFSFIDEIDGIDGTDGTGVPLVIFDDCIYSGHQMNSRLNLLSSYTNRIHIVCPYASACYRSLIRPPSDLQLTYDIGQLVTPFYLTYSKYTGVSIKESSLFIDKHISDSSNTSNTSYGIDFTTSLAALPVYFDHKLAGSSSSFPLFYDKWLTSKPGIKYPYVPLSNQ